MADAESTALSAAVRTLASITRVVTGRYTREGAGAVNIVRTAPKVRTIRIGMPGGEWGWVPIQAFMLDNNWRHPFFGNRRRWYNENIKHGMQTGLLTGNSVDAGAEAATKAFADTYVAEKFK